MRKVAVFSLLLIVGMVGSQILPHALGELYVSLGFGVQLLTMIALAFIMIHVGYEFDIDKSRVRDYGWDYVVAMTAAAFPWIFCCLYFVFVMMPADYWGQWPAWKESLLASRFAAPTSAGILFAMLAAAGLGATWLFRKARILAIFDDLDTVILMIPLKMMMVGWAWQLAVIVMLMAVMLWMAWRYLHVWRIPISWPWTLGYAGAIAGLCEAVHVFSKLIDQDVPIHIEVLLPAFVLGCMMARPAGADPHAHDATEGHQHGPESPREQRVATIVAAVFMVLVGLSLPPVFNAEAATKALPNQGVSAALDAPSWSTMILHILLITVISNLGKMFPALCYRREANWRERVALAIGLWPRGEVGAGVLIISLAYGIGGPIVTAAMLSLALNLVLTGVYIVCVKQMLAGQTSS